MRLTGARVLISDEAMQLVQKKEDEKNKSCWKKKNERQRERIVKKNS